MSTAEEMIQTSQTIEHPQTGESLDKVRDILFGVQMRDYDKRFGNLEERLIREAAILRDEVRNRFDTLERFIKSEIDSVSDRLKSEREERESAHKEMATDLRDLTRTTEKKNIQLDELLSRIQRELRQQLLDQSRQLSEEMQSKYAELSATLARESQSLRSDKADRSTLASLLSDMALRLADESRSPGKSSGK